MLETYFETEEDDDAEDLFRDLDEGEPAGLDANVAHSPGACAALVPKQPEWQDPPACEGLPRRDCAVRPLSAGQAGEGESLVSMLCGADMCEVFSPPRVGLEARKFGLTPGDAMDLTTGWDLNREEHRRGAEAYVDKEEP